MRNIELRDYLAGQALAQLGGVSLDAGPEVAYRLADAMLAARGAATSASMGSTPPDRDFDAREREMIAEALAHYADTLTLNGDGDNPERAAEYRALAARLFDGIG